MDPNPYAPPAPGEPVVVPPPTDRARIEAEIQELAQTAMTYAAVGVFCVGFILGPVAISRANRALRLIDQHGIGQQYRTKATYARIIGIAALILFTLVVVLRLRHAIG